MGIVGDSITRVTKPLRCTSLHQSTLAAEPAVKSSSLTFDTSDYADSQGSDDQDDQDSDASSREDCFRTDVGNLEDYKNDGTITTNSRRNSPSFGRRTRRISSGSNLRPKQQKGLSLNYTSPTTTASAINEVFSRRESHADDASQSRSPEVDRVIFLAELPDAIARARKVHYRREALLPKTKSFTRVQKTLQEDNAPFELDLKKEATLAGILMQKVTTMPAVGINSELKTSPGQSAIRTTLADSAFLDKPDSLEERQPLFEKDDTLFTMEDINPAMTKLSASSIDHNDIVNTNEQRHSRTGQLRASRPSKRKNEEARYEPYTMSLNKRRAISPSPSSPLGSPNVKASILRIEDLSL